MESPALVVDQLRKSYGSFTAVDGISFQVPRGAVIGLLGPNGAGKTTTMQLLTGITELSSGRIEYFGVDFLKHRRDCLQRINFTSAYNNLQNKITVLENLKAFAYLYSVKNPRARIDELCGYFDITQLYDQRFSTLSAGQSTRVNLVKAMINEPELILMDEPTASLDPDIRDRTLQLIEEMRTRRNLSILYTSHNMDEVSRLCDEVIFLDHGQIIRQDTPQNLTAGVGTSSLAIDYSDAAPDDVSAAIAALGLSSTHESERTVVIEVDAPSVGKVLWTLGAVDGFQIVNLDIRKADLEDVFLELARKPNVVVPH